MQWLGLKFISTNIKAVLLWYLLVSKDMQTFLTFWSRPKKCRENTRATGRERGTKNLFNFLFSFVWKSTMTSNWAFYDSGIQFVKWDHSSVIGMWLVWKRASRITGVIFYGAQAKKSSVLPSVVISTSCIRSINSGFLAHNQPRCVILYTWYNKKLTHWSEVTSFDSQIMFCWLFCFGVPVNCSPKRIFIANENRSKTTVF